MSEEKYHKTIYKLRLKVAQARSDAKRALELAQKAIIEVEAMKRSTHKIITLPSHQSPLMNGHDSGDEFIPGEDNQDTIANLRRLAETYDNE